MRRCSKSCTYARAELSPLAGILLASTTNTVGGRSPISPAKQTTGDRAVLRVVLDHCPTLTTEQAQTVISTWLKTAMIESRDHHDPTLHKMRAGLFVVKRPG